MTFQCVAIPRRGHERAACVETPALFHLVVSEGKERKKRRVGRTVGEREGGGRRGRERIKTEVMREERGRKEKTGEKAEMG